MDEREMVEFVDRAEAMTAGEFDAPIGHVVEDVLILREGMTVAEADVANSELQWRGSAVRALGGVTSWTVT